MHTRTTRFTIPFAFSLITTLACSPLPPIPAPTGSDGVPIEAPTIASESEEQEAKAIVSRAAAARAVGNIEEASELEDMVLRRFQGSLAAVDVLLRRAREHVNAERFSDALDLYRRALFFRPDHPETDRARREYADVLMDLELYDEAAQLLGALFESSESVAGKITLGLRYSDAMRKVGRSSDGLYVILDLLALNEITEAHIEELQSRGQELIRAEMSLETLALLYPDIRDIPKWLPFRDLVGYELIARYYDARSLERSKALIEEEILRPDHKFRDQIIVIQELLINRAKVNKSKLGILLPLSGRDRVFGRRMQTALQSALGESNLDLIFKDSGGVPEVTAQAYDELVLQDHVIGIIGPFRTRVIPTAVQKAEDYGVPTITLSHSDNYVQESPWALQTGITPGQQARELAKVAFDKLGYSQFAILHPSTTYGTNFRDAFWDEVIKRKGEIRGIEEYEHNATTFKTQTSKLVGRHYHYAREDYREALEALKAQKLPSHRLRAAIEKLEKNIKPLVDFDAIIIPDRVKNIGLIAPALAVEDIIMTLDPKRLERIKKSLGYDDLKPVRLMGGSTWNNQRLGRSCGRYCDYSIFVDGFFRRRDEPTLQQLDIALKDSGERVPTTMADAVAFDTGRLLKSVLALTGVSDRATLREALLKSDNEGLTGGFRFNEDGHIDRELFVLTLRDSQVAEWREEDDPATEAPESP